MNNTFNKNTIGEFTQASSLYKDSENKAISKLYDLMSQKYAICGTMKGTKHG